MLTPARLRLALAAALALPISIPAQSDAPAQSAAVRSETGIIRENFDRYWK